MNKMSDFMLIRLTPINAVREIGQPNNIIISLAFVSIQSVLYIDLGK